MNQSVFIMICVTIGNIFWVLLHYSSIKRDADLHKRIDQLESELFEAQKSQLQSPTTHRTMHG